MAITSHAPHWASPRLSSLLVEPRFPRICIHTQPQSWGPPTALGAEVLQDASQGPAAGQVSQGPRTAGNQEGVVPGTWRETTAQSVTDSEVASWEQALHGHQPSSSLLLPATVSQDCVTYPHVG